jgi:tRNA (guanine37-N1)-methyltransferase
MKARCLIVPRRKAQEALQVLREMGVLRTDLAISEGSGDVNLPLALDDDEDVPAGISAFGKVGYADLQTIKRPPKSYKDLLSLPEDLQDALPSSFDVIGDVCIIKLPEGLLEDARAIGEAIIGANRNIRKVAIDRGVKGDFRVRDLTVIAGDTDLETVHIENNVRLKLDPSLVYFSPRLASERLRIAQLAGTDRVLDMFCGVGPFALTVARHSSAVEVVGIDLNPDCIRFFNNNISLNSVQDRVSSVLGDARDVAPTLGPLDRVIMNLPHSSMDYLGPALECIGEGAIHLYRMTEGSSMRDELRSIDDILKGYGREYKISMVKEVHQYSPTSHMMVFDISVIGP